MQLATMYDIGVCLVTGRGGYSISYSRLHGWVKEGKSGRTVWRGKRVDMPEDSKQDRAVLHTCSSNSRLTVKQQIID